MINPDLTAAIRGAGILGPARLELWQSIDQSRTEWAILCDDTDPDEINAYVCRHLPDALFFVYLIDGLDRPRMGWWIRPQFGRAPGWRLARDTAIRRVR